MTQDEIKILKELNQKIQLPFPECLNALKSTNWDIQNAYQYLLDNFVLKKAQELKEKPLQEFFYLTKNINNDFVWIKMGVQSFLVASSLENKYILDLFYKANGEKENKEIVDYITLLMAQTKENIELIDGAILKTTKNSKVYCYEYKPKEFLVKTIALIGLSCENFNEENNSYNHKIFAEQFGKYLIDNKEINIENFSYISLDNEKKNLKEILNILHTNLLFYKVHE